MKKKWLSLLLTLAMCLSLFPGTALAADNPPTEGDYVLVTGVDRETIRVIDEDGDKHVLELHGAKDITGIEPGWVYVMDSPTDRSTVLPNERILKEDEFVRQQHRMALGTDVEVQAYNAVPYIGLNREEFAGGDSNVGKTMLQDGDLVSYVLNGDGKTLRAAWLVASESDEIKNQITPPVSGDGQYVYVAGKSAQYYDADQNRVVDYTLVREDGTVEVVTAPADRQYTVKNVYWYTVDENSELLLTTDDYTRQQQEVDEVTGTQVEFENVSKAVSLEADLQLWDVIGLMKVGNIRDKNPLLKNQTPAEAAADLQNEVSSGKLERNQMVSYVVNPDGSLRAAFIYEEEVKNQSTGGGGGGGSSSGGSGGSTTPDEPDDPIPTASGATLIIYVEDSSTEKNWIVKLNGTDYTDVFERNDDFVWKWGLSENVPSTATVEVSGDYVIWIVTEYEPADPEATWSEISPDASSATFSVQDGYIVEVIITPADFNPEEGETPIEPEPPTDPIICPECGQAVETEDAHKAPCGTDGHYDCDGKDHAAADCGVEGHWNCDGNTHDDVNCWGRIIIKVYDTSNGQQTDWSVSVTDTGMKEGDQVYTPENAERGADGGHWTINVTVEKNKTVTVSVNGTDNVYLITDFYNPTFDYADRGTDSTATVWAYDYQNPTYVEISAIEEA